MVRGLTKSRLGSLLPRPFTSVSREVDQLFDQFLNGGGASPAVAWYAPAALWEDADGFHVEVDLPGVKQDDIDVTVEKGVLRISAERKLPEGERKYWHQERGYGSIQRVVSLPETVDPESIAAELHEGVLRVNLTMKPEAQPKRIEVKVNG